MPQVETITPNQNTGFLLTRSTDQAPVLPALPVEDTANPTPTPPPSLRTNGAVAPALPSSTTATTVTPSTNIDVTTINLSNLGSEEPRLRQLLASDENARNTFLERLKSDPTVQATIEELRKLQGTVISEQLVKALEAKLLGEGPDAFSIDPQTGAPNKLGAWLTVQGAQQLLRSLQELSQKVASGAMTAEDAQFQTTLKLFSGGAAGIVQGPAVLTAAYIMQNMVWEWTAYRSGNSSQLQNRAVLVSTSGQQSLLDQVLKLEEERREQLQRTVSSYNGIGNVQNIAGTIDQLLAGGVERSIISYALARAEGNVTERNALKGSASGHDDPGNGARNTGRFSVNSAYHGTFASASAADNYFWGKVEAEARRIAPILQRAGLQINALNVSAYLSFWLQSPAQAAEGLIPQFSRVAQQGASVEAWRTAMHNAADSNPLNPTGSTRRGWWAGMSRHIQDQNRRLGEIVDAINRAPSLGGAVYSV